MAGNLIVGWWLVLHPGEVLQVYGLPSAGHQPWNIWSTTCFDADNNASDQSQLNCHYFSIFMMFQPAGPTLSGRNDPILTGSFASSSSSSMLLHSLGLVVAGQNFYKAQKCNSSSTTTLAMATAESNSSKNSLILKCMDKSSPTLSIDPIFQIFPSCCTILTRMQGCSNCMAAWLQFIKVQLQESSNFLQANSHVSLDRDRIAIVFVITGLPWQKKWWFHPIITVVAGAIVACIRVITIVPGINHFCSWT